MKLLLTRRHPALTGRTLGVPEQWVCVEVPQPRAVEVHIGDVREGY